VAPSIVLVHGAFNGAWCFDPLVERLRARGRDVLAIDLPGHGDDPRPFTDLHGDAAALTAVLDGADAEEGVILVGHSYGGAVVTEAGGHPAVRQIVYIAAYALDTDETCVSAAGPAFKAAGYSHAGRPNLGHAFLPADDGTATLDPAQMTALFYNDCDQDTIDWALPKLGAQPLGNLRQEPAAPAWRTKPSIYAVCSEDMTVHPGLQAIMAARCGARVELAAGHFSFLSQPDVVADLLDGL
jgi:pimeloyl-ACP methyl ester carboxylesterase